MTTDLFALAIQHHQAGQFTQAAQLYQQLLQDNPHHAQAWQLLGTVQQTLGQWEEAAHYYQQALTIQPHDAIVLNKLGVNWQQMGNFTAAIAAHQQAIQTTPTTPRALAFAYNNLGLAQQALGDLEAAAQSFHQAFTILPELAEAHYNLGNIYLTQRQLSSAIAEFQQALTLKPNYIKAQHHLGLAYHYHQQWAEAEACYHHVLTATQHPSRPHAWHNLGQLYQQQGRFAEAITLYEQALSATTGQTQAEFYNLLGNVYLEQHQLNQAIDCFNQAQAGLSPTEQARNLADLGAAYHKKGAVEQAIHYFQHALDQQPNPILYLRLALTLPIIYPSAESVATWRHHLLTHLAAIPPRTLDPTIAPMSLPTAFLAAYQGYNDRDLQAHLATLYQPPPHPLNPAPAASAPLTVGFISAHFKHHTVGKLIQGFIAKFPRPEFKVVVFSIGSHHDPLATFIRDHADVYLELSAQLDLARQQILAQNLDLLCYADIGMEPFSYALGLSRLAPVQCVTWGHSITSGLPELDYYISSSLYESHAADTHYTEQLIHLKTINTYFYRPAPPPPTTTRPAATIYLCPQSLYKYHPDFDPLLREILRRDPQGRLWLLSGQQTDWNNLLWQRFQTTMPDVLDRVEFVPRQDQAGFLQLLTQADVILDPPHFGGCNSSLEAFAFGLPIVAMPSEFLRGRFTAGFYQAMGLPHLIAHTPTEYIELAVRLGTDVTYRQAVNAQILAAHHVLYENMAAVTELADFFRQAIHLRRAEMLYQQANSLRQTGQIEETLAMYRQVSAWAKEQTNEPLPQITRLFAQAQDSLGVLLGELGQLEAAAQAFQMALTVYPDQAEILNNLGVIRQNQGQVETALTLFQRALATRPDFLGAYSNLLLTSHYLPDPSSFTPPAWTWANPSPKPRPAHQCLTIGYISPDFRQHPVAYFMQALLAHHQTPAICYADVAHPDPMTDHLRGLAHQWRDIYGQSDEQVAAQIQADQVDILVELAGHTGGNRLSLLAQKPAPIQISYLGYPSITGLPTIDYRLTDRLSEGSYEAAHLLYLPDCFLCYTPPADALAPNALPALTQGYITFGSCNHLPKLNPSTLSLWAQLLQAIPTARLLLKTIPLSDPPTLTQFQHRLTAAGLPLARVDLYGYTPQQLDIYHHIDIALDPFPYNGTTTTCEALYMGVPVITLAGKRHAGRVGVSLLTHTGLSAWIGQTREEYLNLAIRYAHDLDSLAQLRATLRQQFLHSSLCDGATFTRHLEQLYQQIKSNSLYNHTS